MFEMQNKKELGTEDGKTEIDMYRDTTHLKKIRGINIFMEKCQKHQNNILSKSRRTQRRSKKRK